jgi:hypothetical protein
MMLKINKLHWMIFEFQIVCSSLMLLIYQSLWSPMVGSKNSLYPSLLEKGDACLPKRQRRQGIEVVKGKVFRDAHY